MFTLGTKTSNQPISLTKTPPNLRKSLSTIGKNGQIRQRSPSKTNRNRNTSRSSKISNDLRYPIENPYGNGEGYQHPKSNKELFRTMSKKSTFEPPIIQTERNFSHMTSNNPEEIEKSRLTNNGEQLYPGKPARVDIPKEIETMFMSEDFTYESINRMEYLSIPSAKVL